MRFFNVSVLYRTTQHFWVWEKNSFDFGIFWWCSAVTWPPVVYHENRENFVHKISSENPKFSIPRNSIFCKISPNIYNITKISDIFTGDTYIYSKFSHDWVNLKIITSRSHQIPLFIKKNVGSIFFLFSLKIMNKWIFVLKSATLSKRANHPLSGPFHLPKTTKLAKI